MSYSIYYRGGKTFFVSSSHNLNDSYVDQNSELMSYVSIRDPSFPRNIIDCKDIIYSTTLYDRGLNGRHSGE